MPLVRVTGMIVCGVGGERRLVDRRRRLVLEREVDAEPVVGVAGEARRDGHDQVDRVLVGVRLARRFDATARRW